MTLASSKKPQTLAIESSPSRLTPDQIVKARKTMAGLKSHPRDALPNATALARADALHVQLSGPPRAELAEHITNFRAALETQDRGAIQAAREILVALPPGCDCDEAGPGT